MKYLGIDIGGTNIKYGIVDSDGNILSSGKKKTPMPRNEFLEVMESIIAETMESNEIEAVGISCPGFIDNISGVAHTAGALDEMVGYNIKEHMSNKFNIHVSIDNDVNCFALAEKWKGNAVDADSFVTLTIGTGIGGAIYVNGDLFRGANFAAGEFGFIRGNGNCREYINGAGFSSTCGLFALRQKYAYFYGIEMEEVTGEMIFDSQEPYPKRLVIDFYEDVAGLVHMLLYSLNPAKILFGGAISERPDLIDKIKESLYAMYIDKNLTINLDRCKFKNDSGVIGAVYNAIVQKG